MQKHSILFRNCICVYIYAYMYIYFISYAFTTYWKTKKRKEKSVRNSPRHVSSMKFILRNITMKKKKKVQMLVWFLRIPLHHGLFFLYRFHYIPPNTLHSKLSTFTLKIPTKILYTLQWSSLNVGISPNPPPLLWNNSLISVLFADDSPSNIVSHISHA